MHAQPSQGPLQRFQRRMTVMLDGIGCPNAAVDNAKLPLTRLPRSTRRLRKDASNTGILRKAQRQAL